MGRFIVNLKKKVTQEGGGASPQGLAVEREGEVSPLSPCGPEWKCGLEKNTGKLGERESFVDFFLLNINVLTVRCNISWRGILTGGVGRGGDYRVWRWKKIS